MKSSQTSSADKIIQAGLWSIILLLLLISLQPVLTRSHVEGFTYLTETMSLMGSPIAASDPLWDVAHTYFYLTRPGTIWLMAPLSALAPGSGYDLLMFIMMPVFLFGLVILTKLWSGASMLASVASLLFVPIALDAQFFLNDSVVAAGFSIWGLILLTFSQRGTSLIFAGMLLSLAILCRLDQVLLVPLFLILCILGASNYPSGLQSAAFLVMGAVAVHIAAAFIDPQAANLLYRISAVSGADALWARGDTGFSTQILRDFAAFAIAFGVGLPAIWFGFKIVAGKFREQGVAGPFYHGRLFLLLLMIYPVVIYAVTVGKYYDPRGFMTLLPFVAPAIAIALEKFVLGPVVNLRQLTVAGWAKLAVIVGAFGVPGVPLLSAVSAVPFEYENAVFTLTGRIWHVKDWGAWQDKFHASEASVNAWLGMLDDDGQPSVILSATWTPDRTLQNVLVTAGFEVSSSALPACDAQVVFYQHPGGARIYHIRSHIPFLPNAIQNSAAVFVQSAEECLRAFPAERRFALEPFGAAVSSPLPDLGLARAPGGLFQISDAAISTLSAAALETLTQQATATVSHAHAVASDLIDQANATLNAEKLN